MSTFSEAYPLRPGARVRRLRTRDDDTRPGRPREKQSGATPIMGPPNRAPGMAIMGASGPSAYVMGGPDVGPRVNAMGAGDRGLRLDLFGESDLRFVDSLFTSARNET